MSGPSTSQLSPSLRATGSEPPEIATSAKGSDTWLLATAVTLGITGACLLAIALASFLFGRRRAPEEQESAAEWPVQADDPIVAALGIPPETALRARRARRLRDSLDERARTERESAAPAVDRPSRRSTRQGR